MLHGSRRNENLNLNLLFTNSKLPSRMRELKNGIAGTVNGSRVKVMLKKK